MQREPDVLGLFGALPVVRRWHVRRLWGDEGVAALDRLLASRKVSRCPGWARGVECREGPWFVRAGSRLPPPRQVPALSLLGVAVVEARLRGVDASLAPPPSGWRGECPAGVLRAGKCTLALWVMEDYESAGGWLVEAVSRYLEKHPHDASSWGVVCAPPVVACDPRVVEEPAVKPRVHSGVLARALSVGSSSGLRPEAWFLFAEARLPQSVSVWTYPELYCEVPDRLAGRVPGLDALLGVLSGLYGGEVRAEASDIPDCAVGVVPGGKRVFLVDGRFDAFHPVRLLGHDPRGPVRGVYALLACKSQALAWGKLLRWPSWVRVVLGGQVFVYADGSLAPLRKEAA